MINVGSRPGGPITKGWNGEADTYALLPDPSLHTGEVWLVKTPTGIYWINRKDAGMYISSGSTWTYLGRQPEAFDHDLNGDRHTGITGTENNFMALDADGLPIDSEFNSDSFVSEGFAQRFVARITPTANGIQEVIGWYELTDSAVALTSAAPVTPSVPGYVGRYVIDVSSSVGLPFTIRLTGTSANTITGVEVPADTEDIAVSAGGYYQSAKVWVDAPSISIVEASKSCTLDIYRVAHWRQGDSAFKVEGIGVEWVPDSGAWSLNLEYIKVNTDGSKTTIESFTFASTDTPPRAENGIAGRYIKQDYTIVIDGAQEQGLYIQADTIGIAHFYTEVRYDEV